MQLLNEKVITLEDLTDFSDDLKAPFEFLLRR